MFDEAILEEIGLTNLSEEQKTATLESLNANLANRVGAMLTNKLSEADLVEFERMLESEGDAATLAWLKDKAPDQQAYIDEAKTEIIKEIKDMSAVSQGNTDDNQ